MATTKKGTGTTSSSSSGHKTWWETSPSVWNNTSGLRGRKVSKFKKSKTMPGNYEYNVVSGDYEKNNSIT